MSSVLPGSVIVYIYSWSMILMVFALIQFFVFIYVLIFISNFKMSNIVCNPLLYLENIVIFMCEHKHLKGHWVRMGYCDPLQKKGVH